MNKRKEQHYSQPKLYINNIGSNKQFVSHFMFIPEAFEHQDKNCLNPSKK